MVLFAEEVGTLGGSLRFQNFMPFPAVCDSLRFYCCDETL